MIKIGDIVRVVDYGECYSTYGDFFIENGCEHLKPCFIWNRCLCNGDVGIVKFVAKHRGICVDICAIKLFSDNNVYLIAMNGLKIFEYNENEPVDIKYIMDIYSSKSDSIIKINNNQIKYITDDDDEDYDGREDEDEDYWDV